MTSVLGDRTNVAVDGKPSPKHKTPPKRKLEDIYQKKTQLEHILLRPDTYIGSVERDSSKMWVFNEEARRMELRLLSFVPGLYKIFDEILVNAADNKVRDSSMNSMVVTISQEDNTISVWNNGKGLPVQVHAEQKVYVPEMVFGMLLTSSNYNDTEKKVTGGRNGYGAKLTNIFSTEFSVETYDSQSGRHYKQVWRNNMSVTCPPTIKETKGKDFTCVTFKPDLSKFKMTTLEDDIVALMKKRVYDMAGCTHSSVKVTLNGTLLPICDFKGYCQLYPIEQSAIAGLQFEVVNDRWTVCMAPSDKGFQQVSFVNSILTFKGGKHVDYIVAQVADRIAEKLKKKKYEIKPGVVKNNMFVFINCLIENPAFDSQTKETLTTTKANFGSVCQLSEKLLKNIEGAVMMKVINEYESKVEGQLNRKAGGRRSKRVTGIAKLEEANEAGGPNARKCTLVLTEGDSAKTLAISGFSVVGRDWWGVFPLRGKMLNVREANPASILKNQEVQNLMKILGLKLGETYTSTEKLRYGHLMIMADQDHDGSHIKGLLINFIHFFWPGLLENCPGFLLQFITPIVKASKGNSTFSFFSMPEYLKWYESTRDVHTYKIKYYKGLGTSTPEEAKRYFKDLEIHRIVFDYLPPEDSDSILLAFDRQRVDDRKTWLTAYAEGSCVDYTQKHLRIKDFVDKELILFSRADCERSIPSVIDGFKPSLRKILFCCFKKKGLDKHEIKVAQLSGYVSEHSAYHHGEVSLQGTIIGMAQDFVGSNNINLLYPVGQFGTRIDGGKDASQPRYLFTYLTPLARALFPASDDELLTYRDDDGCSVEPYWYVPIIPMILVNGGKGIGTGFSTSIPMYNPVEIVNCIKTMLKGGSPTELHPWYRDYTGRIERKPVDGKLSYNSYGKITRVSPTVVNIRELPVERWTSDYKQFLEDLLAKELIHEYREHHTDVTVDFEVQMDPETLNEWEAVGLEKKFDLVGSIPVSNLVCFDRNGRICKYASVADIIKEFFAVRSEFYRKRKDLLVASLSEECTKLQNMARFVMEVVNNQLHIMKRKSSLIIADLRQRGYKAFPPRGSRTVAKGAVAYQGDEEAAVGAGEEELDPSSRDYDYLLGMKMWSLALERVEKLQQQKAAKEKELEILLRTSPEEMWMGDLDNFLAVHAAYEAKRLKALHSHEEEIHGEKSKAASMPAKAGKGGKHSKQQASARLEHSTYVPKRSDKAKKLSEEAAVKKAKEEETQKRREVIQQKKAQRGEGNGDSKPPAKRRKLLKDVAAAAAAAEPADDKENGSQSVQELISQPVSQPVSQPASQAVSQRASQPKRKPAPAPKRRVVDDDDDDDKSCASNSSSSDSDVEEIIAPKRRGGKSKVASPEPAPTRALRERKPVCYKLEDSGTEDSSDDDGESSNSSDGKSSGSDEASDD